MCTQYLLEYFQNSQYLVLTWVLFLSTRFIPGCWFFKLKYMAMFWNGWCNRVVIAYNIQANLGPLLCFLDNNSSSVDVYLFIVSPAWANRHWGITFFFWGGGGGLNPMSTVFEILRWHKGKGNVPSAQWHSWPWPLKSTRVIQTDLLNLYGTFIGEVFYNNSVSK